MSQLPQNNGIPQCILDLIELPLCGEASTAPVGVHRLTDIPILHDEILSDLASGNHPNARKVYESALRYTTNNFLVQLRTLAKPYIVPLLADQCLCRPPALRNSYDFQYPNSTQGIRITFASPKGSVKKLPYIWVMADTVGPINLTIKEGTQSTVVTGNITTAKRLQRIETNYTLDVNSSTINICLETSTAYKIGWFDCLTMKTKGCCGNLKKVVADSPVTRYASVENLDESDKNRIAGIQPCVRIDCDPTELFCRFADMLAPAVIALMVAAITEKALHSHNVNLTTLTSTEDKYKVISSANKQARTYFENAKELMHDFVMKNPSHCFRCGHSASSAWIGH